MIKPVIEKAKDAKRRIIGYYASVGDIKLFGHTEAEARDKCEQAVIAQCETGVSCTILTFGRYTVIVTRIQYKEYEYSILDSERHYRYGKHFSCCSLAAADMRMAVSSACCHVAQWAHDQKPQDTELMSAILSYVDDGHLEEFNRWRQIVIARPALVEATI